MPITIGSNIASLQAVRQLGKATDTLTDTYQSLSSGLRINKASDDAAGLAIATGLNTYSRVYTQGVRNLNDGVSSLNIAEGALGQLSNITIRQKELAEQAANGVYSATQRRAMATEANALTNEFNRVVQSTTFNGRQLLDGSYSDLRLQAGFGSSESLNVGVGTQLARVVGDGSFTQGGSFSASTGTVTTLVDLDNDGKLDIIFAGQPSGTGVMLGNGDGTFKAQKFYANVDNVRSVQYTDFNNDGKLDLIADTNNSIEEIMLGNGDGTFLAAARYATAAVNTTATAADVNGDGWADFVTSDATTQQVHIFLNNKDGTFRAGDDFSSGVNSGSVVSGDFNGDGKLDLAVGNGGGVGTTSILFGNGDGSFKARVSYVTPATSLLKVTDLNNDGYLDFVTSSSNSTVNILINNGDGTFQANRSISISNASNDATVADFNGDGIQDLGIVMQSATNYAVFIGNGDGTFRFGSTYSDITNTRNLAAGDVNGDGVTDIVLSQLGAGNMSVQLGNQTTSTLIAKMDLFTRSGALSALGVLDSTLQRISSELGSIGSNQARLAIATSNLQSSVINFDTARSRIMDTDVAQDSATLTSTKIRQEAAASILAQANQQPALALVLLR